MENIDIGGPTMPVPPLEEHVHVFVRLRLLNTTEQRVGNLIPILPANLLARFAAEASSSFSAYCAAIQRQYGRKRRLKEAQATAGTPPGITFVNAYTQL